MLPHGPLHRVVTAQGCAITRNTPAIKHPPPGAAGGRFGQGQVVEEVLGLLWASDEGSVNKKVRGKYS